MFRGLEKRNFGNRLQTVAFPLALLVGWNTHRCSRFHS